MMKLGSALFYLGLAVAAGGFLVDKAQNLPGGLRLVAPAYVRASQGLTTLQIKGSLESGDTGFAELEEAFRREAEAKGVAAELSSQRVVTFTRRTAAISFSEPRSGDVIPIEVTLSLRQGSGQASNKVEWDMAALRARAEELKRTVLVRWSIMIFALGVAVTMAGRALENRGKMRGLVHTLDSGTPPPHDAAP